MDPRVDPSDEDNFAVRYAAAKGHAEVVALLLNDSRVDPGAENNEGKRTREHIYVVLIEFISSNSICSS